MSSRERWWMVCGLAIGLVLGGARCSFHQYDSKPGCKAEWEVTTGQQPTPRNPE